MRKGFHAVVAGGLGFAVSLIAACGSSTGLLSSSTAQSLTSQLQQVSSDIQQGNCAAAADDLAKLTRNDLERWTKVIDQGPGVGRIAVQVLGEHDAHHHNQHDPHHYHPDHDGAHDHAHHDDDGHFPPHDTHCNDSAQPGYYYYRPGERRGRAGDQRWERQRERKRQWPLTQR